MRKERRLGLTEATFFIWFLLVVTGCFLFGCSERKGSVSTTVTPAFYHWETKLQFTEREIQYLDENDVNHLYVRFFDVDRKGGNGIPVPVATTEIDTTGLKQRQIIPVVFITNRTLKNMTETETDSLADRMLRKVLEQWDEHFKQDIPEIQVDCDWSESTRPAYFRLLQSVKQQLPQTTSLSATIRLHQVKYFQRTGVPPVDRGMLMYYNMGEVSNWETENSILDTLIASSYLHNFDRYPLSLDVALPIFSWGAIFRDEVLVQLVHHLNEKDLLDTVRFEFIGPHRFRVKKSTYLEGFYCYKDDLIRLEGIDEKLLKAARKQLQAHLKEEDRRIVFYHLHDQLVVERNLWEHWNK